MTGDVISSMYRQLEFLNPNYDTSIQWEGVLYPSLRHALEATKTIEEHERREVSKMSAWAATNWGVNKPHQSNPWHEEWISRVSDFTILLTAQKFGLIKGSPNYDRKLLYGYHLVCTGDSPLIYAGGLCDTLWGICTCNQHLVTQIKSWEYGTGENLAGQAEEACRARLSKGIDFDPLSADCDWCFTKKRRAKLVPGKHVVLYFQDEKLVKAVSCDRHKISTITEAKHHADNNEFWVYPIDIVPAGGTEPETFLRSHSDTPTTTAIAVRNTTSSSSTRSHTWYSSYKSTEKDMWGTIDIIAGEITSYAFSSLED